MHAPGFPLDRLDPDERASLDAALFCYPTFQEIYWSDPAGLILECIDWTQFPAIDRPAPYQLEMLTALAEHHRAAVRGPHGLGKTAVAAWAVIWFALTRDGRDWKIATTASVHRQLTDVLWPEIHKWARVLRWGQIGRAPLTDGVELLVQNLKLRTGKASPLASSTPGKIEGWHANHLLFIFDESKTIPDNIFDAAEGAFAGAGRETGREALGLAISTPGEPQGRFYQIHSRKRGYEEWWTRHVTREEAIAANRLSAEWCELRARQWGAGSPLYINRVLGEFAAQHEDGVIPLGWMEAANERWLAWKAAGCLPPIAKPVGDKTRRIMIEGRAYLPETLTSIGIDVKYTGPDQAVQALRHRWTIREVRKVRIIGPRPLEQQSAAAEGIVRAQGGIPIVDLIGYGAGVYEALQRASIDVLPFSAEKAARRGDQDLTDSTGEIIFANMRAAGWWHLRELLNPESGIEIAIPPDEEIPDLGEDESLEADLLAPRYAIRAGNRLLIEKKEDIAKRLGRSTDWGDAVVQAFALELLQPLPVLGEPIVLEAPGRWAGIR